MTPPDKKRAPVVGLTWTGRRNVVGKTTAKILEVTKGAGMAKKLSTGLLGGDYQHKAKDILSARFMVPPFSVLNTREGWWQQRKRQWIDIGIRSELGRGYEEGSMSYTCGRPEDLAGRYRNSTMSTKYDDHTGRGLLRPPKMDLREKKVVPGGGGPNSVMNMRGSGGDGRKDHKKFMITGKGGQSLLNYYKGANPRDVGHGGLANQMAGKFRDASPGGSPKPAMKQRGHVPGQPIVRGDGRGRPRSEEESPTGDPVGGTSVFDPVLCELAYRWFCRPEGKVLDPFAGGSVRGIVAGELGLHYTGIELSQRQIAANQAQADQLGTSPTPVWINGDSVDCRSLLPNKPAFDLLFSCPPYGDLERYSDDPRDLSTLPGDEFDDKYGVIIKEACGLLKPDSFAVFVVGDYRDKDGFYRNLPGVTIDAFANAGLHLYNTLILVNVTGSLPLRINNQFLGSRKIGTTHQTVLVFCKGQPKSFVKNWPPLEIA